MPFCLPGADQSRTNLFIMGAEESDSETKAKRNTKWMKGTDKSAILSFAAGGGASAIAKTSLAPIERVKIILQTQAMLHHHTDALSYRYRGFFPTLFAVAREQGIRSLWMGNGTNCLRIVPTYALRFALYHRFQQLVSPGPGRQGELSLARQMAAGALSGATAILFVYPLDLARTRLSADVVSKVKYIMYNSMKSCANT
eukprot:g9847.t1